MCFTIFIAPTKIFNKFNQPINYILCHGHRAKKHVFVKRHVLSFFYIYLLDTGDAKTTLTLTQSSGAPAAQHFFYQSRRPRSVVAPN
jgi:hypothetical protein